MTIMKKIRKFLILILLFFVGSWVYQNNYEVRAAANDSISSLRDYFTRSNSDNVTATRSSSNNNQATWSRPEATVYVDLQGNAEFEAATEAAINAWNNTGAFTFKRVNSRRNAQIVVTAMNTNETTAAGVTSTIYNPITTHLLRANVRLNSYYLQNPSYNYSFDRVVNTVEHELGHAIGLGHNRGASVMYPAGSYYGIRPNDINRVRSLYNS